MWGYTPVMPTLGRQKQVDQRVEVQLVLGKFQAIHGYIMILCLRIQRWGKMAKIKLAAGPLLHISA